VLFLAGPFFNIIYNMKINQIDLIIINLPFKKYLRASFGTLKSRETLIIKFYSKDGLVGHGESSLLSLPLSEPETISSGIELLENEICPLIINQTFDSVLDLKHQVLDKFPNNPVTKIGIEGAFYHLLSQKNKVYLGKSFGVKKSTVQAGETINISDNPEYTLKEVRKFLDKGYKTFKVKIAPGNDLKVIKGIRERYKTLELGVDANGAYGLDQVEIFKKLDKFNLTMIEQPFRAEALHDHAKLQAQIETPICLDESIKSLKDTKNAFKLNSCKIINIKPARIGSYYESIQIHDFCLRHNIDVFAGGRLESGVGKAFNLALAGLPGYNLPIDMSSSLEYFADDIINPFFDTSGGLIKIPDSVGLGFEIDERKIQKYTLHKITIE